MVVHKNLWSLQTYGYSLSYNRRYVVPRIFIINISQNLCNKNKVIFTMKKKLNNFVTRKFYITKRIIVNYKKLVSTISPFRTWLTYTRFCKSTLFKIHDIKTYNASKNLHLNIYVNITLITTLHIVGKHTHTYAHVHKHSKWRKLMSCQSWYAILLTKCPWFYNHMKYTLKCLVLTTTKNSDILFLAKQLLIFTV